MDAEAVHEVNFGTRRWQTIFRSYRKGTGDHRKTALCSLQRRIDQTLQKTSQTGSALYLHRPDGPGRKHRADGSPRSDGPHRKHGADRSPRPDRSYGKHRADGSPRPDGPHGKHRADGKHRPNGSPRPDRSYGKHRADGKHRPNGSPRPDGKHRPNGSPRPDGPVGKHGPNGSPRSNRSHRKHGPNGSPRPDGPHRKHRPGRNGSGSGISVRLFRAGFSRELRDAAGFRPERGGCGNGGLPCGKKRKLSSE